MRLRERRRRLRSVCLRGSAPAAEGSPWREEAAVAGDAEDPLVEQHRDGDLEGRG